MALASGLSVVASALVRAPLDMVKTQLQAGAAADTTGALQAAWGRGGVRGLYRGAGLALGRDVPFFSINLALYEQLKASALHGRGRRADTPDSGGQMSCGLAGQGGEEALSGVEVFLIGAAAQGAAGLLTNPIDVLKTRVQAGASGAGVLEALKGVLAEHGARGLLRGAAARVAWIAPQGCIYYPVYEYVQSFGLPPRRS